MQRYEYDYWAAMSLLTKCIILYMQEIERTRLRLGQKVIWYLNSESLSLRHSAKAVYGSKLLTNTEIAPTTVDCRSQGQSCAQSDMSTGTQLAAAELFLSSLADYHVVTLNSGFGMVAAWMSSNWNHIYGIHRESVSNRRCGLNDYDSLYNLSILWQGIKR